MQERTQREIAHLRAQMSKTEWDNLAKWGLEPGGVNEISHAANGASYLRAQEVANGDNTQLRALFGKDATGTAAAMKLLREDPAEYRRLRARAKEVGLIY